jgi:SAM-dependent methyltransferase
MRHADGSAGDADYARIADSYAAWRTPDPRIARHIHGALGSARTVLNVGAGTGSYEPTDRAVTAVEPSASMRARRPPQLGTAIDATAGQLPFADRAFDAAMALVTVHQWPDLAAGLAELRRVSRGPVVILTFDPARLRDFWLDEYAPEVLAVDVRRFPAIDVLARGLGGTVSRHPVPIPLDCSDRFIEAYYGRPEGLLDAGARRACSAFSMVAPEVVDAAVMRLAADLHSGTWDARWGALRRTPEYIGSLELVVAQPA